MLRKAFTLERPVKRAVLYYAAHGMAEMSLNGTRVDDTLLGPPFTDYTKRIVYRTVEVTRLLAGGTNVLGAVLGNGFLGSMRGLNGGPGAAEVTGPARRGIPGWHTATGRLGSNLEMGSERNHQ